jgi:excisionase family DNA binding protein
MALQTPESVIGSHRDRITLERWLFNPTAFKGCIMSKRLLSTAEAADYLGVSVNTIRNYMDRGLIAPHRTGPRPLLKFDPADLDEISPKMS